MKQIHKFITKYIIKENMKTTQCKYIIKQYTLSSSASRQREINLWSFKRITKAHHVSFELSYTKERPSLKI